VYENIKSLLLDKKEIEKYHHSFCNNSFWHKQHNHLKIDKRGLKDEQ